MNLEKYPVKAMRGKKRFEFNSIGARGKIKKVIIFQKMGPNFFNLAFGDWDKKISKIDSSARSNNGDRDKILATVASVVHEFLKSHVNATILLQGATAAKTRLYQMGINKHFPEISRYCIVEGLAGDTFEQFQPGKSFEMFKVKRVEKT